MGTTTCQCLYDKMGYQFLNNFLIVVLLVLVVILAVIFFYCKSVNKSVNNTNNQYQYQYQREISTLPTPSAPHKIPSSRDHIDSLGNSHSPELAINIIPTAPTLQKNNIEDNVNDPPPPTYEAMHTYNVTKISLETLV